MGAGEGELTNEIVSSAFVPKHPIDCIFWFRRCLQVLAEAQNPVLAHMIKGAGHEVLTVALLVQIGIYREIRYSTAPYISLAAIKRVQGLQANKGTQ